MARNGRKVTDQECQQLLGTPHDTMNFEHFCKLMAGEDQDLILTKIECKYPLSDQIEV